MTADHILNVIIGNGYFCNHPCEWDDQETQKALEELVRAGLITPMSDYDPEAMNAEYIFVERK